MDTTRSFFAIDFSQEIINKLSAVKQNISKNTLQIIRWVNKKNQHLTLKFLGNLKYTDIPTLQDNLKKEIKNLRRFSISITNLGAFPNLTHPRVVWIGIEKSQNLLKLFQVIESATTALGYPKDSHPFSPHITLGRIKKYSRQCEIKDLISYLKGFDARKIGGQEIKEIILYKSDLKPTGPTYTRIFSLELEQEST